jgi:hypothetical protein
LPKNRNVTGRFDTQPDLAAVNINDRDADIFTNADLFTEFTTKYQHDAVLLFSQAIRLPPAMIVRHETKTRREGVRIFFVIGAIVTARPVPKLPAA